MLKWAVTEHFREYLPHQPFLVRTDNNPLTYIMTTPNLNATGHQWVGALVRFNFQLKYQKGWDNTMADVLSQITTHLSPEAMQSILDGVALGAAHRVFLVSSEESQLVWRNHYNFMIHQKALYLCSMSKGENEDLLLLVVPRVHRVTTLNGCH